MGCITSTQPKKLKDVNRSQTEMMLNRSASLNDQLRIIIDDDRYKHIDSIQINTTKYSTLDSREHSSSTAESTTSRQSSQCSNEISVSHSHSSMDIIKPPNGGVTLMGFATNDDINKNIEESTSKSDDSEPSIIQTNSVTLMGIADSNEIFVSTNTDLQNRNPQLLNYLNKSNDSDNINNIAVIKQKNIVTPGCC